MQFAVLSDPYPSDKARLDGGAQPFYRPELDALRFWAFLLVFMAHALPADPITYASHHFSQFVSLAIIAIADTGAFGVDLFFVLSAYLITELLLREKHALGKLDVKAFYVRRMLRIWPLYFIFVAISYGVQFVFSTQSLPGNCVVWFVLLAGNWVCAFRTAPLFSVIAPLWSVSIEEQFYLSWPWAVRRLSARDMERVAIVLLVIATVTRCYLLAGHADRSAIWFNTFTRLDPIAAGILLALALRGRIPSFSKSKRIGLFAAGYLTMAFSSVVFHLAADSFGFWQGMLGYPAVTLGAVAMFLATLGAPQDGLRFTGNRLVTYLGKISYGLYVFHSLALLLVWALLTHLRQNVAGRGAMILLAFALTVAFAALSYRFLEAPMLRLKRRFTYVESRAV